MIGVPAGADSESSEALREAFEFCTGTSLCSLYVVDIMMCGRHAQTMNDHIFVYDSAWLYLEYT